MKKSGSPKSKESDRSSNLAGILLTHFKYNPRMSRFFYSDEHRKVNDFTKDIYIKLMQKLPECKNNTETFELLEKAVNAVFFARGLPKDKIRQANEQTGNPGIVRGGSISDEEEKEFRQEFDLVGKPFEFVKPTPKNRNIKTFSEFKELPEKFRNLLIEKMLKEFRMPANLSEQALVDIYKVNEGLVKDLFRDYRININYKTIRGYRRGSFEKSLCKAFLDEKGSPRPVNIRRDIISKERKNRFFSKIEKTVSKQEMLADDMFIDITVEQRVGAISQANSGFSEVGDLALFTAATVAFSGL